MARDSHTPVLIVGGGPVGLGLAIDLGWRGIECLLVEQGDGTIAHPRANAENARTMEFFRRWGIADRVREAGTPRGLSPHRALSHGAHRIRDCAHRAARPRRRARRAPISPERPQRCNQLWLDPILRDRAASFPSVTLRLRCRFELFEQDDDRRGRDGARSRERRARADCGRLPRGLLRRTQRDSRRHWASRCNGTPTLEYNLNIFFRTPELWSHHDKGKAALHFFADAQGIWRTLVQLDGRELWRLGLRGKDYFDNAASVDACGADRRRGGKAGAA